MRASLLLQVLDLVSAEGASSLSLCVREACQVRAAGRRFCAWELCPEKLPLHRGDVICPGPRTRIWGQDPRSQLSSFLLRLVPGPRSPCYWGLRESSHWGASSPSAGGPAVLCRVASRGSQLKRRLLRRGWLPGWTQQALSTQSRARVPSVPDAMCWPMAEELPPS